MRDWSPEWTVTPCAPCAAAGSPPWCPASRPTGSSSESDAAATTPGRAYLRRRRAQRDTVRNASRVATDLAEVAAR
ncbi:hypothetical protein ABZW47_00855 [Streptomyces sp. NPDC004549]|uniref:hypothetical protein n=1 Tax=Streptomyces sp. NPDC004549 TaxID=3154283 RepID=UPI0033BEB9B8